MGNKNILLWAVSVIALVLSVIAIVAPKGQQSDASQVQYTVEQGQPLDTFSDRSAIACRTEVMKEYSECLAVAAGQIEQGRCRATANAELAKCDKLWTVVPGQNEQ